MLLYGDFESFYEIISGGLNLMVTGLELSRDIRDGLELIGVPEVKGVDISYVTFLFILYLLISPYRTAG